MYRKIWPGSALYSGTREGSGLRKTKKRADRRDTEKSRSGTNASRRAMADAERKENFMRELIERIEKYLSSDASRHETNIPHEEFMMYEDGDPYCRGIVFSMDSIRDGGPAADRNSVTAVESGSAE